VEPPARKLPRQFGKYAALEAGNMIILPAVALKFGWPGSAIEAVALGLTITAAAGFLFIGALYWRGLDRRLRTGDGWAHKQALGFAGRAEWPLLVLTALATVAFAGALTMSGWTPPVIAAGAMSLLGWLEYINYYHRQLQHFDNWADFHRLVTTRRLKRAHMARDLAAFRRG
jgi:hypothetical protein